MDKLTGYSGNLLFDYNCNVLLYNKEENALIKILLCYCYKHNACICVIYLVITFLNILLDLMLVITGFIGNSISHITNENKSSNKNAVI